MKNVRLLFGVAIAALFMGAMALAQAETEAAQPQQSEVAAAKLNEAREVLKAGDTDKAITLLNEAQAADANNAEVYHFRGVAHASKTNFQAAAADLEKAIEIDPANAQSHYYLGIVYSRLGQRDKSINHYQTFLKLAPDSPDAPKVQSLLRATQR